ncbi:putative fumarylacetoacetate hydrolase domain-containing protein 2a [Botryosphaeria dothidea]|uniref:Fumarylacetoacetate hydrolase domain-containing protein 2a n=1 Tax=Botryosphaeria dothidea TaxID=55169 RepID=A0A8H4N665_9PEZI|nr:putative fumarylacetoacetate hydrolase domain-containing protein 2a [Botryosphaeria dothidea]
MAPQWTHLIRFIAKEDGQIHLGQVDSAQFPDVGLAVFEGKDVSAKEVTGGLYDGVVTERVLHVDKLLSPLSVDQIPLVRCLGLNYRDHAKEASMPIPNEPILFIKPRTALNGPFPAKINVPKIAQDGTSDYEAELTIVIAKDGKDIPEDKALDYVLGYTCGNDVSARAQQFKNSQWCFSKGFDGSAPIGPVLVSGKAIGDPHKLDIKAIHNKNVVQDSNTKEMIFDIARTVSFLSTGTTLEKGTLIMTGTGPGVGAMRNPKVVLQNGDDMRVQIQGIGTLINEVYYE